MALLLGVVVLLLAALGKLDSKRLARLCGWLGLFAITVMALVGVGRVTSWTVPTGYGPNFSLSYVRQRLPSMPEALYDGSWATEPVLGQLKQARSRYPTQVRIIDQYIGAWYFWHQDAARGEAALWRLGMQSELVRYYAAHQRWDMVEQIAQGAYLANVAEALPSGRVEAMKALARRANNQEQWQAARRFLLEAFKQSGRLGIEEQDRLWQQVSGSLGQEISWTEYYRCLQQLCLQAQSTEALARLLFEMKKVEQLHPELLGDGQSGLRRRG